MWVYAIGAAAYEFIRFKWFTTLTTRKDLQINRRNITRQFTTWYTPTLVSRHYKTSLSYIFVMIWISGRRIDLCFCSLRGFNSLVALVNHWGKPSCGIVVVYQVQLSHLLWSDVYSMCNLQLASGCEVRTFTLHVVISIGPTTDRDVISVLLMFANKMQINIAFEGIYIAFVNIFDK